MGNRKSFTFRYMELLKVIIELYAYDVTDEKERAKINDLLYGHKHLAMFDFLFEKSGLKLKPTCKKLLNALTDFYSKARYHRYSYNNNNKPLNSYYGDDLYALLKRIEQAKKELIWYLIKEGDKLPVVKSLSELPALPFEQCYIPEFINDLIVNRNSSSMLYEFVSDAYDELVEKDKAEWKNRMTMIDELIGNTNVYLGEFDDLCDDFDIDE